jgi:acyl-CoA thioesterase FadM
MGVPLEVRGRIEKVKGRKVVVSATVSAGGEVCASAKVVAVQMPAHLMPKKEPT